ncbi:MAG: response regulator transcription factor [Dehalococcoidia bacterium]|nr:response regulator transcription factor [Dehalococcoidia bacterium]MDW8120676.1 response regulator transcription factor [Chloroflexota bacterium]
MERVAPGPISVLIVDDHALFREGIKTVLSSQPDIQVVGEAGTGQEGIALARTLRPDVVLMDVRLPDMDGLEAARAVHTAVPTCRVIILTGLDDPEYLKRALLAGAAGYRLKSVSPESLVRDIRTIMDGGSIVDASLWPALVKALAASGPPLTPEEGQRIAALTPTEREVLRRMAQGQSNAQIAQDLHYSEGTVKNMIGRIFAKLGVGDRAQAVYLATRAGII